MPELSLAAPQRGGASLKAMTAAWAAMRPYAYAALEARRNRLLYAGWPVVILGSLPLSAAIAMAADYAAAQGVTGALAAWTLGGLPITAILFGAVAGAGLRGGAEDAEAALPVSPRARTLAALAAAAAALAASAGLIVFLTFFVSPEAGSLLRAMTSGLSTYNWNRSLWTTLPPTLSALASAQLGLFWLLTVAFGVSLVSAHAVLGGVAALFAGAVGLLPILAGLMLQMHSEAPAGFLLPAVVCSAALAAGAIAALERAAAPTLRGMRWSIPRILLISLLPLAGSLAAWPSLYWAQDKVLAATWDPLEAPDFLRPVSGRGAADRFRVGLGGRLVLEQPTGTIELLPGWTPTIADLVWGKPRSMIRQVLRDSDGTIWAEVLHPGTQGDTAPYEIWVGQGDGPLRRYLTIYDGTRFAIENGRAFVYTAHSNSLVRLDPAKPPLLKSRK